MWYLSLHYWLNDLALKSALIKDRDKRLDIPTTEKRDKRKSIANHAVYSPDPIPAFASDKILGKMSRIKLG